jgi:hypothetical protein
MRRFYRKEERETSGDSTFWSLCGHSVDRHGQRHGSQPDRTAPYGGQDLFGYPILHYFTFS